MNNHVAEPFRSILNSFASRGHLYCPEDLRCSVRTCTTRGCEDCLKQCANCGKGPLYCADCAAKYLAPIEGIGPSCADCCASAKADDAREGLVAA